MLLRSQVVHSREMPSGPTFRLAGKHVFTITNIRKTVVINWQVDREETPEGAALRQLSKSLPRPWCDCSFNLPKISAEKLSTTFMQAPWL